MMRDELMREWRPGIKTVLDLGCRDCWHTAGLPGVERHVGVEVWPAALERARMKIEAGGLPNFEPVEAEALAYIRDLEVGAFDAVLAIDLLEHFTEEEATALVDEMGRVAGRLAVVWTTLGYIEQGPHDVDGQPNPYEEHQHWKPRPRMFADRGWKTRSFPMWHGQRGGALLAWKEIESAKSDNAV